MTTVITVGKSRFQLIETLGQMMTLRDEDGMVLSKLEPSVRRLEDILAGRTVVNMMEFGIHRGGSAAFFAELLDPTRLAAFDILPRIAALEDWIDAQDRRGQVKGFYEFDQADAERLRAVHADFFAGEPIDLVNDDASHTLDRTRATFNAVFPMMREGGAYIIEDWAWHEKTREFPGVRPPQWRDAPPLSDLVVEIMKATARKPGLIEDVLVNCYFVVVRKGPLALDEVFDIRTYA